MRLPWLLQKLWGGWMAFSHVLGIVMSSILLTILWIVAFGAYAIILQIVARFGKQKVCDTYWTDVSREQHDFLRQF